MNPRPMFPILALLVLTGCYIPQVTVKRPTPTPALILSTDTVPPPLSTPELGLPENPLILTLGFSATTEQINAARYIAEQIAQRTGHNVVTVIPSSPAALVDEIERGNAHIVLLDPFSYELAYQRGLVRAMFAVVKDGKASYGAQFIAARRGGFKSYFDENSQTNTADASTALKQFANKKPCWTDEKSPSGYVIPLGFLNANQIPTQPAAFVQGHPTVVRSIYAGGICDFGATYIDARKFPSLEDQYPDLIEQIPVIWQVPEIIPYPVLALSTMMPINMQDSLANSIPAILQTDNGKAAFKTAYDIEELLGVNDAFYDDFRRYVRESRIDLSTLNP